MLRNAWHGTGHYDLTTENDTSFRICLINESIAELGTIRLETTRGKRLWKHVGVARSSNAGSGKTFLDQVLGTPCFFDIKWRYRCSSFKLQFPLCFESSYHTRSSLPSRLRIPAHRSLVGLFSQPAITHLISMPTVSRAGTPQ